MEVQSAVVSSGLSSGIAEWMPTLLGQISNSFELAEPEDILEWSFATFGEGVTLGTAFGVSGMVLLDMAHRVCPGLDVFYIDTGVFFPETYELIERAQERFGRKFRRVTPALTLDEQEAKHGPELWENDSNRCCKIRKVIPLSQAIEGRTAWVTALRRDQSETRRNTPVVQWNGKRRVVKVAPLANMTEKDIWRYVHKYDVPYNQLHNQGYPSIGCWPCTSQIKPGEDMRAGRWRGSAKTECGLHT